MNNHSNKPARRLSDAELTDGQLNVWNGIPEEATGYVGFPREGGDDEVVQSGLIRGRLEGTLGGELTEDPERHEKMATLIASVIIEGLMSALRKPEQIRSFILGPEEMRGKHGMSPGVITIDLPDSLFNNMDLRGSGAYGKAKELKPNKRQMQGINRRNEWVTTLIPLVQEKIESFLQEKLDVKVIGERAGEKVSLDWKTFIKGETNSVQVDLDEKMKNATVKLYPSCGLRNCSSAEDLEDGKFFTSLAISGEPTLK